MEGRFEAILRHTKKRQDQDEDKFSGELRKKPEVHTHRSG